MDQQRRALNCNSLKVYLCNVAMYDETVLYVDLAINVIFLAFIGLRL